MERDIYTLLVSITHVVFSFASVSRFHWSPLLLVGSIGVLYSLVGSLESSILWLVRLKSSILKLVPFESSIF